MVQQSLTFDLQPRDPEGAGCHGFFGQNVSGKDKIAVWLVARLLTSKQEESCISETDLSDCRFHTETEALSHPMSVC